jgi:hypothetical protein
VWYADFLRDTVIPYATTFGWAIEVGEVVVAALLVIGAVGALTVGCGPRRLPRLSAPWAASCSCSTLGCQTVRASSGLVAPDSFDEGIPLDVLAFWLQLVLVGAAIADLVGLQAIRVRRPSVPSRPRPASN